MFATLTAATCSGIHLPYGTRCCPGIPAKQPRALPRSSTDELLGSVGSTSSEEKWHPSAIGSLCPVPHARTSLRMSTSLVHWRSDALGFVLRQAPIFAIVRLSNGSVSRPLRVIADTAGDGLYLSHYITNPHQLCGVLAGTALQTTRTVAIRFVSPDPRQWSGSITVAFWGADARH